MGLADFITYLLNVFILSFNCANRFCRRRNLRDWRLRRRNWTRRRWRLGFWRLRSLKHVCWARCIYRFAAIIVAVQVVQKDPHVVTSFAIFDFVSTHWINPINWIIHNITVKVGISAIKPNRILTQPSSSGRIVMSYTAPNAILEKRGSSGNQMNFESFTRIQMLCLSKS